jgi:hypothetical protein
VSQAGRFIVWGCLVVALCTPNGVRVQGQTARPGDSATAEALPPREIQQLMDGYAVVQGQEFLGLNDAQFAQFLPRFRALQDARRRHNMERLQLLQELNRMTNPRVARRGGAEASDADVRERLKMLRDVETRGVSEIAKARDAIDQTLDLRQQARFRVFEEQVEQRKLQLLMQVRQNRANRPGSRPPQ